MAIETTIFRGLSDSDKRTAFCNFLANSGLFDSVTIDDITVKCYVDETDIIDFFSTSNSHYAHLENGFDWFLGDFTISELALGVKTSKGIYIKADQTYSMDIFIAKTNEGNICVFKCYHEGGAALVDIKNSAAYEVGSYEWSIPSGALSAQSMTVLAPVPCYGANTYADGLYLQAFNEFPYVAGEFVIGDKHYYSNGYMALKDGD